MEVLNFIELKNIYDLYWAWCDDHSYSRKYYCPECKHTFSVDWFPDNWCRHDGSRINCPSCGTHFTDWDSKLGIVPKNGAILNASLVLKKYRKKIVLDVKYLILRFSEGNGHQVEPSRETITFSKGEVDLKVNSLDKHSNQKNALELGNPFDFTFFNTTRLVHLSAKSNISKGQKSQMFSLLKNLREAVAEKLWPSYQKKSAYISNGSYGYLALPIFNIAWRTVFPDAPNLPIYYRNPWDKDKIRAKIKLPKDKGKFENLRNQSNFIDSLLNNFKIPLTATNRKILADDFTEIDRLRFAHRLSQGNIDVANSIYQTLKKKDLNFLVNERFFKMFIKKYSANQLAAFIKKEVYDCSYMWRTLSPENKQLLINSKIRLRDLHDWMANKHRLQKYDHIEFKIPDHIIRRLQMQNERLKFFLPEESRQLYKAGEELHNCVATYSKRMETNETQIVLVTDDKGKLMACLEIKNDTLVQAKLDRNKSVSINPVINQEILDWAKKANLKIVTKDVVLVEPIRANESAAV